jgi:hypothetical protein
MTRHALLVAATFVTLSGVSARLYGFGSATHAYIAREVGAKEGPACLQEIYGALLPDAFNIIFGDPYQDRLATLTHYEFTKLVEKAASPSEKALAYGFASHNEAWGADRAAHVSSMNDPGSGYVIRKSDELAATLRPSVKFFLLLSGVPDPDAVLDEVLPVVTHTAIETAIDVLICQKEDPEIGQRLVLAAQTRGWSAPILLCKAYAADLATTAGTTEAVAGPLIIAAETGFRYQIELYGTALSQENPIDALADQGAELAKQLLGVQQGMIVDISADLMKLIMDTATDTVKDDYGAELAATITQVRKELESHGLAKPN